MIKDRSEMSTIQEIDLKGPDGNAFVLLAYAKNYAKQLGFDSEKIVKIQSEMTSGDYENLIKVFDNYFGDMCTLYR